LALSRPLLPVVVRDVALQLAHPAIANTHVLDYRSRSFETGLALATAVASRPPAPALPHPLPPPPVTPMSYMNHLREQVDAPFLNYGEQAHLLLDLRQYLTHDEDERQPALVLIRDLRTRRDIAEGVAREIDQSLSFAPRPTAQPDPTPPRYPPPRPQNAATLTPVSQASSQAIHQSPAVTRSAPLGSGLFAVFVMVAAFFPIGGLVIGAVLLANPQRRSQGTAVMCGAAVGFLIWLLLLA